MKEFRKKKHHYIPLIAGLVIILAAVLIAPSFIPQSACEFYSENVFPAITLAGNALCTCEHFSLSENIVVCGGAVLAAGMVYFIVMLIVKLFRGGAGQYLCKVIAGVLVFTIIFAFCFQLMHGMNFRRYSAKDLFKLEDGEYTIDDYTQALDWAYNGMVSARAELGEDYNGVGHMQYSFEDSSLYANSLIDSIMSKYGINASPNFVRAKPVALSHYWSYLHITGAYDPILGEVNINTDYMDITDYGQRLCHEILHAKGFASETDCNMIAVIACLSASRPDFRYCGYYQVFWSLYNVTAEYCAAKGVEMTDYVDRDAMKPVLRDARASSMYWKVIDSEVTKLKSELFGINATDVAETVNNAYLEAYGQDGGTDTYTVPENYYLEFYETYVVNENA